MRQADKATFRARWLAVEPTFLRFRVLALVLGFALLVLRRPDALYRAQFWAEDGVVWYADAHRLGGFAAMLLPSSGYFQTLSRLAAWGALQVPLTAAPLFTNLVALSVKAAPIVMLWSARYREIVPATAVRCLLTVWFALLPNLQEVHGNLTNAQWFLAIHACLTLAAPPARSLAGRLHDLAVIALSGLSGPFSILLAPIALMLLWQRWRERARGFTALLTAVVVLTAAIQLGSLALTAGAARTHAPLGASAGELVSMLAAKPLGTLLFGTASVPVIYASPWLAFPLFGLWSALLVVVLLKGPTALRAFTGFALLVLGASLMAPMVSAEGDQVALMGQYAGAGSRYFLLAATATFAAIVWLLTACVLAGHRLATWSVLGVVALGLVTGAREWKLKKYRDLEWRRLAREFEQSRPGSEHEFPINPNWTMVLVKH